jgi:adenosylcobinamide-phosphate synthase
VEWADLFYPLAIVSAGAMVCALAIDLIFGEPPQQVHPVVWMGKYLELIGLKVSRVVSLKPSPVVEFYLGMCGWFMGATLTCVVALGVSIALCQLPYFLHLVLLGAVLKTLLSWRMLRDEVIAVEQALSESIDAGRQRVSWLVSRDVNNLDEYEIRQAAISTLAENLNDSVVAPLFWFAVAGLPGAAVYRFANTADAMWGYIGERQGRDWTWAGKWAARADDVLSWVPARITALLIMLLVGDYRWHRLAGYACLTPSPNSGWPMGAMALVQDIQLGKTGVYLLNPQGRLPNAADTKLALHKCSKVVGFLILMGACIVLWSLSSL